MAVLTEARPNGWLPDYLAKTRPGPTMRQISDLLRQYVRDNTILERTWLEDTTPLPATLDLKEEGMDSLDIFMLCMEMEKVFGQEIPEHLMAGCVTTGNIYAALKAVD